MRDAILRPTLTIALTATYFAARPAFADEGGVSFWLPGNFGSLAAVPGTPGWSWATVYYHGTVAAGADQLFPRGRRIDVGISGTGDLAFFGPTYVFATPVIGGTGIFQPDRCGRTE